MRKLIVGFLFLLFFTWNSNIFAAKPEPMKNPFRVAFYIDDFGAEWKGPLSNVEKDSVTRGFAINLYQNASDVIFVTDGILENFIVRAKIIEDKGFDYRRYPQSQDPNNFLKSIKFDIGKWNIYKINDSKFYALTSKDKEHAVKVSNIVKIDKWELVADIKKIFSENLKETSRLNSLKNIFVTDQDLRENDRFATFRKTFKFEGVDDPKDLKLTSFLRPMNIILNGHGNVDKGIAGMDSDVMTEVLNFLNELHVNAVLIFSCSSGGKNLDFMQFRSGLDKQKISMSLNYLLIVSAISDAPIISSYAEEIKTDKDIDSSTDVKGFFEAFEKLKTKKKDPSFLTNVLKKLTLSTNWFLSGLGINNIPQILIPNVGWFQYFDIDPDIQKITDASIAKALAKPEIEGEQLKGKRRTKLKKMTVKEKGIININQKLALLLYPDVVTFELVFSPKKFEIINKSIKLGEEEIIGFGRPRKNIITTNGIPQWLNIWSKYFPTNDLVSTIYGAPELKLPEDVNSLYFYPSIISMQRGDALHLLAKVSVESAGGTETGILSFIRSAFLNFQERESQKTFFIKELNGYNDFSEVLSLIGSSDAFKQALISSKNKKITLQNVFIKTSFDAEKDLSDIEIAFGTVFGGVNKYWYFKTDASLYKEWHTHLAGPVWAFNEIGKNAFFDKLGEFGLKSFIDLKVTDYIQQVSELKNLYQSDIRQVLKTPESATQEKLSFKDYLLNIDFDKFKAYVASGRSFVVTKAGVGEGGASVLKTKLKKLKTSLCNLKFKLNALQQKLVILKKTLSGEKIEPRVHLDADAQKVAAKEVFAIVKRSEDKKITPAEFKSLAEKFTLVSNIIKDDVAAKIAKRRFEEAKIAKFKIELVESFNLNDPLLDVSQKLNLSYILISLIHNLYFKSIKFIKITDKYLGGDFISSEQLAPLIFENVYQIMQTLNALDDSNFYILNNQFLIGQKETEKLLPQFLDIILVCYKNLLAEGKAKYEKTPEYLMIEPFVILNDLINGAIKSDSALVSNKLKELNEKFKLLDTGIKIVLGQILVSKLSVDAAKVVWMEILKLLNFTQDDQSIWQNSNFFDLYGLAITILLKNYDELVKEDKKNVQNFSSRIFYELKKNTDYNNVSKQYFYFSLARFFVHIDFNDPSKTNTVIENVFDLNIKEVYKVELAFGCVNRYKGTNPDLYSSTINSNFHKNLEIISFDAESFTLKSGNKYFYKDLQSLRFAFNLITYFLITAFDSGKNTDWVIDGVMKSDYLPPEYKKTINDMISTRALEPVRATGPDGTTVYCKKLKPLLPKEA